MLNYVELTGTIPGGTTGTLVQFTPSNWLADPVDLLLIPPAPDPVYLTVEGTFSVELLATDNSAPVPAGWYWTVAISGVPGVAYTSFSFSLLYADGATQDISRVAQVQPADVMQAYMPLPSGTPTAGQVPAANASGQQSAWATLTAASVGADPSGAAAAAQAAAEAASVPLSDLPLSISNGGTGEATASTALTALGGLALTAVPQDPYLPSDNALQLANYDPAVATSKVLTKSYLQLIKLTARANVTVSNVWLYIGAVGVGASSGSYVGAYTSSGEQIFTSTDVGADFLSTGPLEVAMGTTVTLTPGEFFWVAVNSNLATTQVSLVSLPGGNIGGLANIGLTPAYYRWSLNGTSVTTLPGSITPANNGSTGELIWAGAS